MLNNADTDDSDPNIHPDWFVMGDGTSYYLTLQNAYDAAQEGDIIESQIASFTEDLYIDLNKSVTIQGGYNGDFSSVTGKTTLNGDIIITNGTLTLLDFILH